MRVAVQISEIYLFQSLVHVFGIDLLWPFLINWDFLAGVQCIWDKLRAQWAVRVIWIKIQTTTSCFHCYFLYTFKICDTGQ